MYGNISDQLNVGQFLFYSIIFFIQKSYLHYTASILDTCYNIFFIQKT